MGSIAGTGFTHHIAVNVVALAVFLWENFFVLKISTAFASVVTLSWRIAASLVIVAGQDKVSRK